MALLQTVLDDPYDENDGGDPTGETGPADYPGGPAPDPTTPAPPAPGGGGFFPKTGTGGGKGNGGGGSGVMGRPMFNFGPTPDFEYPDFRPPSFDEAFSDPGYQFRLRSGTDALERSAAARGVLRTGGTLKDIVE